MSVYNLSCPSKPGLPEGADLGPVSFFWAGKLCYLLFLHPNHKKNTQKPGMIILCFCIKPQKAAAALWTNITISKIENKYPGACKELLRNTKHCDCFEGTVLSCHMIREKKTEKKADWGYSAAFVFFKCFYFVFNKEFNSFHSLRIKKGTESFRGIWRKLETDRWTHSKILSDSKAVQESLAKAKV